MPMNVLITRYNYHSKLWNEPVLDLLLANDLRPPLLFHGSFNIHLG